MRAFIKFNRGVMKMPMLAIKQRWGLDMSVREAEAVVAIKANCQ